MATLATGRHAAVMNNFNEVFYPCQKV